MITVRLPESILSLLRTKGLTAQRAGELLQVRPSQSARLLKRAGAVEMKGMWRMGK